MGSGGARRFRLGVPAVAVGLLLAIPGMASATPARPPASPPGSQYSWGQFELKSCPPQTQYGPYNLRPAATQTLGIPEYLLPTGMSYFGIPTSVGSSYLKNNLLVAPSSFT
jgi:hypothetical protein